MKGHAKGALTRIEPNKPPKNSMTSRWSVRNPEKSTQKQTVQIINASLERNGNRRQSPNQ